MATVRGAGITVFPNFFGDGSDGDYTVTTSLGLTRDMYYENLTINSTNNISTNGYRIFVKNTLTMNNSSSIEKNGQNVLDGYGAWTGAWGGSEGSISISGSGGDGQNYSLSAQEGLGTLRSLGGDGGNGGYGYSSRYGYAPKNGPGTYGANGGSGVAPLVSNGGTNVLREVTRAIKCRDLASNKMGGGGGGSGGGCGYDYQSMSYGNTNTCYGGGGGGGGGIVMVAAKTINAATGSIISANGGTGGTGKGYDQIYYQNSIAGGGGGGGGGGVVVVISAGSQPAALTLEVNGGTGGLQGDSGGSNIVYGQNGSDGSPGTTIFLSVV